MKTPEFYKLVKKFSYKIVGRMNKILHVSSILIDNITEWSQFTKGTIYLGMAHRKITSELLLNQHAKKR